MLNLDLTAMPLEGRHLIEASAGTGKTFSITRIYLRLLLEKQLGVEQILLMTYTRAATEELRGRIEDILRQAQANWGQEEDAYWQHLYGVIEPQKAHVLLHHALLNLDQAAIYTIHGFCSRALQQYAFASQTGLDVALETNTRDLAYGALQDWLRLTMGDETLYGKLEQQGWHTPEGFWQNFSSAILSQTPLVATSEELWHQAWQSNKAAVRAALLDHEAELIDITMSDAKTSKQRYQQWQDLLNWLAGPEFSPASKEGLGCLGVARLKKAPHLQAPIRALAVCINKATFEKSYQQPAQEAAIAPLVLKGLESIRQAYTLAKNKQQVLEFDDLVRRLAGCLNNPENGALVTALTSAYPVAMVDEFQDTDSHQYSILDALYPLTHPCNDTALFMIGDPKQAIYGFRGGDIHTYLRAANAVHQRWHMDTNWRSSSAMVDAYNALFLQAEASSPFGEGIHYAAVKASQHASANQQGNPLAQGAALRYVCLPTDDQTVEYKHKHLAHWCVAEIQSIIQQGDFAAQDIALLVRNGGEAQVLQTALKAAGLPSVYVSDKSSIYASQEATEMLRFIGGLLHCEDQRQLVRAASTNLWGGSVALLGRIATDDQTLVQVRSQMMHLRKLWLGQGIMPLIIHLLKHQTVAPDTLQERYMTNMVQLAELLQKASNQASSALLLVQWLHTQCDESLGDASAELRLESDQKLIQIVTHHGSKGLEYPIVFIPFASQFKDPLKHGGKSSPLYPFHDSSQDRPALMIGKDPQVCEQTTLAAQQEAVRLLYVAVTRAQYRCYMLVSEFANSHLSPLGLLVNPHTAPDVEDSEVDTCWPTALQTVVESTKSEHSSGVILVPEQSVEVPQPMGGAVSVPEVLTAKTFAGTIDGRSNLVSYSAIARQAGHTIIHAKDHGDGVDQWVQKVAKDTAHELRFTMAKGKNTGLLLHDILEQVDFSQPNWPSAMEVPLTRYHSEASDNDNQVVQLEQWLTECLGACLPVKPDDKQSETYSLSQLSSQQTLREAEFYFPLIEGRNSLAQILTRHRGGVPTGLPNNVRLNGMMHGFIDLIIEHQGRYYVADYKSNHLGYELEDYNAEAMLAANQSHYYDLQYLIYSVALHRYLGQRLHNYNPQQHFGGVYYLYLRGMAPNKTTGVFCASISQQELTELDELFAGGAPC